MRWTTYARRSHSPVLPAARICLRFPWMEDFFLGNPFDHFKCLYCRCPEEAFVGGNGRRLERPPKNLSASWMKRDWSLPCVGMGCSYVPSICSGERSLHIPCTYNESWPTSCRPFIAWMSQVNTGPTSTRLQEAAQSSSICSA